MDFNEDFQGTNTKTYSEKVQRKTAERTRMWFLEAIGCGVLLGFILWACS